MRSLGLTAGAAAAALTLAACGSSKPTASTANTTTASRASQQLKFADCMRQHGVPISDPSQGPVGALSSGAPPQTLQPAIAACRQYFAGAQAPVSAVDRAAFTQAFVKYATCLRARGIDIPDPTIGGEASFGQKLLAAQSLPGFKTANLKCRAELPGQFRGAG